MIERIEFYYNPWLYALMAESAKPEILKMTGTANEIARHLREIAARREGGAELKRVNPIKATSAAGAIKGINLGCDDFREKAVASYKLNPDKKGRNTDFFI